MFLASLNYVCVPNTNTFFVVPADYSPAEFECIPSRELTAKILLNVENTTKYKSLL